MKKGKSILTRCLALVLALVLIVSSANLGAALKVSANSETTVTAGELVAKNYELADWEEALLGSGLLGESFSYTVPESADLVAINGDAKEITAKNYEQWVPVSADIMVDNQSVETVAITDNKCTYTYDGEIFSVSVKYELSYEVSVTEQQKLLNAGAALVKGLDNMAIAFDADSSLEIVEEAMPALLTLCDDGVMPENLSPSAEFVTAVQALNTQLSNNGKLNLRILNEKYAQGSAFMLNNAELYCDEVEATYDYLAAIAKDWVCTAPAVDLFLQGMDAEEGTNNAFLWKSFKGVMNNVIDKLEPVANDSWDVLKLEVGSDYAKLDSLLANVGAATAVNYKTSLKEAETTIHATQNMNAVTVWVKLSVVKDEVGSTELVSGGKSGFTYLTLPQNATADDIKAAVEASGVVESAVSAWSAYSAEHFEATATALPEKLTEDITYTITYVPKNYTVKYGYKETADQLPYGYQLKLPVHENAAEFAYDYTVGGESYMQGEAVTVTGNTEINRTEGKAYSKTSLYAVVGNSMGDWNQYEILVSGALKGDQAIYYRAPAAPEMTLADKVLTVESAIASDYAGLKWVPYTYSNNNDGTKYFDGANVVNGYTQRQAQVVYVLELSNVDAAKAASLLELAKTIDAEEQNQTAGMQSLLAYYDDIGTLNKSYLDALLGTINGFDFTPGDGKDGFADDPDDAENLAMRAYFANIVNALLNTKANYIDRTNNNLMLHTMLTEYKNGGLAYYYKNSEAIIEQVSDLAGYLTDMVGDAEKEAALALLLEEMGKSEFVEKIAKLGQGMTDIKANLLPTNDMIDTSANLKALVAAVSDDAPSANPNATSVPSILSETYTVVDDSAVVLIADLYVDGKLAATVTSNEYDRWAVLTGAMNNELLDKIWAKYDELLGEKGGYYSFNNSEWNKLDDLIGTELTENLSVKVYADATQYTVKVEGQDAQTITINDLTIDLPQHEKHPNTVYEYTVKGEPTRATSYTFTAEDLDTLFVNGNYTISVETLEIGKQMLDGAIAALNNNNAGNTYEIVDGTLIANIAGNGDGLMAFVKGMLDTGYGYIGLNEQPLMYGVEGEGLEVSLQTLINAMLADKEFGSETLINLGKNNGGKVLSAIMQLGIDAEVLYEEAMPFVLNLTSVPEQTVTIANGLEAVKNNMYFKSNGDHLFVYLDLPEKVYEVYLTAMLGISELDKTDMNAINNEIAFNFFYDYVELLANTDVSAQSFENTLKIFDEAANKVLDKDIPDYDIAAYDKYLNLVKKILNSEGIEATADEETMTVGLTGQGKHLITLANKLGYNLDGYQTYLGMVKELKEGNVLTAKAIATLVNTGVDFEAVVVDLNAGIDGAKEIYHIENRSDAINEAIDMVKGLGLANAIDYTDDLVARAAKITGKAAVMLLDDVNGNLTFNDTTILDLNGKTINGNLVANGHVYILDSTLDTANAGSITGTVSGNVTIVAGNYNANVASYLPDGYIQVDGNVRNALYTIESPNKGDLIVTINPDVYMESYVNGYLPSIKALATDIVTDLGFNYYLAAKVAVDGNTIYNIDLDNLVGFVKEDTRVEDFINQILTLVDTEGSSNAFNAISADLLDFAAIEQALINGTEIVSYDITVAPYGAELVHIADGDYVSFNLGSMEGRQRTFKVALKLEEGVNTDRLIKVVGELADIVVAENTYVNVFVKQPYYSNRTLWLDGTAKASLDLDLSKNPVYRTIIAVVLAYGNSDKAEALINAIDDQEALKKVFNTITVEEVFTALKALEREVSFTEMAKSLDVDIDYSKAAEYEKLVHILLAATGYALEKLDITGYTDKTMGMIEEGDSGRYTLSKSAAKAGDVTRRGFTLDASAVVEHVTLSVKIFEDDCLWGDANHDGLVNAMDATLVLQYSVDTLAEGQFFCTKRTDVNGDGAINAMDATLILQHSVGTITKFPVEE